MSSETIDPIELLKDYIIGSNRASEQGIPLEKQSRKIVLEPEGFLAFHQFEGMGSGAIIRLALETQTAWKIKDTQNFCTLGSLWCLLAHKDLKPSEYMRKASEIGVQNIVNI